LDSNLAGDRLVELNVVESVSVGTVRLVLPWGANKKHSQTLPLVTLGTCPGMAVGWLNMAECEFRVLSRQCLDRRLPDIETVISEVHLIFELEVELT